MSDSMDSGAQPRGLSPGGFRVAFAAWCVVVGASAAFSAWLEHDNRVSVSQAHVRASVLKDISFRQWATSHGGVYVPVTPRFQPNPWLQVPGRDVTTTDGLALTLMNPAYMLRELQQHFPPDEGTRSRITSLKPINPANAPDDWEAQALRRFEQGTPEVLEETSVDGVPTLRLMVPFIAEAGCLKCHGAQGYRVGDIRGGVASSMDLRPLLARERRHVTWLLAAHALIWAVGAAALVYGGRREQRYRRRHAEAQSALARSEQQLRDAQAVAHVGSWHLDIKTGHLEWSEETYRLFGVAPGEPLTLDRFLSAVHPEDRERVSRSWAAALEGAPYDLEHRIELKGQVRWLRERAQVVRVDGRAVRATGTCEDITERKRLTSEAQDARLAAEAANRAKSQFLANMSHELRTPLNGVLGMAQLLQDPALEPTRRADYAHVIYQSGEALLAILNDVLDLAKVESGKVELTEAPFLPAQVLEDVRTLYAAPAQGKQLHLSAGWRGEAGERARGDASRLRQVLANLVSNAVKFTQQGEVRLEGARLDAQRLRFTVTDTGPGISPEQLGRLFKPFSQLDDGNARAHAGTGLGLVIARNLAQLMGGDVTVDSAVGRGTTFLITVVAPLVTGEGLAPRSPLEPEPLDAHGRPPRVLIVEDVHVNRRVAAGLLARSGVDSEAVGDGAEAVQRLCGPHDFDAVLMDCQMPGMDGVEATRRVRAWETANGAPRTLILALTAGAFEADRERCLLAGMDEFIAKPLTTASLARVLGALRARRAGAA